MKVTTNGRITIPQAIREQLGLLPGAEVEFEIDVDAIRMIPVRNSPSAGRRLVDLMRGAATVGMSTDEILALTRGE